MLYAVTVIDGTKQTSSKIQHLFHFNTQSTPKFWKIFLFLSHSYLDNGFLHTFSIRCNYLLFYALEERSVLRKYRFYGANKASFLD
ncbi:hypothetical protein ASJ81_09085 [Methanosarcina spelaei]|uniref:Uncharacterized protein n=1 Tax=Methanosarcina spelaei TaxID=1036679 RepID=A0A2A2HQL0_9EURY|nr:hypothetical protein ASJ81_09085 [Methanosarcina spelaei]